MIYQRISKMLLLGLLALPMASCSDNDTVVNNDKLNGDSQFGKVMTFSMLLSGILVESLVPTRA